MNETDVSIELNDFDTMSKVFLSLSRLDTVRKLFETVSPEVRAGAVTDPTPGTSFATSGVASVMLYLLNLFESVSPEPLT